MHKIPVGQTIASAYRFLFGEIGTILGICWFPALLSSLASYFTYLYAEFHQADLAEGDVQIRISYAFVLMLGLVVTIFATSVIAVAITRHVLGRRATGVVAYFAIGPVEWRMFSATIRYIAGSAALIFLAVAVADVAFRIAGVPVDPAGPIRATAPDIVAALIGWLAFIGALIVILRMGFFIPPTIVAENHGGLRRSFELTGGNVLRAFAVIAVLGIPFLLLLFGGEFVLIRSALGPAMYAMSPAELLQRASEAMEDKILPWEIFTGVIFVLGSALIYGGAAVAYRASIGDDSFTLTVRTDRN
jgi:hypothetical protein